MREWNSPWNPFNSAKVLIWREWLEACITGDYLPPVTVDIDLSRHCNFACPFCNAYNIINNKLPNLPIKHWLEVSDFIKEWGAYSACVAGGGEPLTHKGFNTFIQYQWQKNGIQNGVITNGSLMTDEHIAVMAENCRWVGFSMDAGTAETYIKLKGIKKKEMFRKVCDNIAKLCRHIDKINSKCDVAYKYLIHPDNAHEIYQAAKLAKELGVRDFHSRPVGFDNIKPLHGLTNEAFRSVVDVVNEQIEKALELEDENFHFYGIRHKFQPNMERKVAFKKCRAIPLIATFGADGNMYLCFDMRGRKDLILCSHYPNPREILGIWGSDFHKNMINNIDPKTCPRCTFGPYNEIIEKVFLNDSMCRYFP